MASSAAIDLRDKKQAYRRNGIQEYLVWQVFDQKLDWFYLHNEDYISLPLDNDGIMRSRAFPGLWLKINALLERDMAQVLSVLQSGLVSVEHQAFVQQLTPQADS